MSRRIEIQPEPRGMARAPASEVVTAVRAGNKTRRPYVVRQWGQTEWADGGRMALVIFRGQRRWILLREIRPNGAR